MYMLSVGVGFMEPDIRHKKSFKTESTDFVGCGSVLGLYTQLLQKLGPDQLYGVKYMANICSHPSFLNSAVCSPSMEPQYSNKIR